MRKQIEKKLNKIWYQPSICAYCLLPLSWCYQLIVSLRRFLYGINFLSSYRASVPVVVVGNITVGGTGKTPFVIWLVEALRQAGIKAGVVSRGYGAKIHKPILVAKNHTPEQVGDEPLLIFKRTQCDVMVSPNRAESIKHLVKMGCELIISDDGLQHYQIARDLEIVMIDGVRGLGNGFCLPAGPLREAAFRLKTVDYTVFNGGDNNSPYRMQLKPAEYVVSIQDGKKRPITDLLNQTCCAIAAIANPARFFTTLSTLGLSFDAKAFPDHYFFKKDDIIVQNSTVVMTEKDAVKCSQIADSRHYYLPVDAQLSTQFSDELLKRIHYLLKEKKR